MQFLYRSRDAERKLRMNCEMQSEMCCLQLAYSMGVLCFTSLSVKHFFF